MNNALAIPTIPIDQIAPSPSNPRKRFDETYLQELAASLLEHGMIQPITVRPLPLDHLFEYNRMNPPRGPDEVTPTYEIVVGECRWRAARLAGLNEVPAFWRELDDKQVLEIQVIENLQRRDVHPLEESDGYRQLIDRHGYRAEDLALKIGKSRSYVFARLKLCALGDAGREMFYAGGIEASVALIIARLPETDQIKMLKQLRQSNEANGEPISFRDAKWRIRNGFTIDLAHATFPLDDAELLPAAGSCTDCPKRSGNAPEICPDIDTADVCTDTRCFEEKRLARREQLLDGYRAKNVLVYVDDDAKMIAPGGNWWSIDMDRWRRLGQRLEDDPERRTIAEILGKQAPVSAVVEVGEGRSVELLELIETTALAEALAKAGWSANTSADDDAVTGANGHSVGTYQRQREENAQALAAENARRKALRDRIVAQLCDGTDPVDIHSIVAAIVLAQIRQESDRGEDIFIGLEKFGIVTPDEYDEAEEIEKLAAVFFCWPLVKLLALMAWNAVIDEAHIFNAYDGVFPPTPSLDALARAVGLPDVAEAPDPADAAQASDALHDEKQAEAHELWPFPTRKNETRQTPIETNEKPKARGKAKAKAVA
jgi:ParB/RepB/Spo0J family partition protein